MNIYNIKESAIHETSGVSFNIYLSGCKGYCKGCHSKHTWDFNSGSTLVIEDLIEYMKGLKSFTFDHICILGGEPLDHPSKELCSLLEKIKTTFPEKYLWLYTHFEKEDVDPAILEILDFIKIGKFIPEANEANEQYGVFLASDNQRILKLK